MKQQHALMWGIVLLAVVGLTLGCFIALAPNVPRYTFWICLVDVLIMEITAGVYLIYNFSLSTNRLKSKLPVAMHISILNTIIGFYLVGVVVDILFLALFNAINLDIIFLGLLIAKWIALIILFCIFWFAGQEGEEEKPALEYSRKERINILDQVQQALVEVRRLKLNEEELHLKQQVSDELEILRNQVRSWTSARPKTFDENKNLEDLIRNLASSVGELSNIPLDGRKSILIKISDVARNMSRELRRPVTA